LEEENSGSGLENQDYGHQIRSADYMTSLYPQRLALSVPTNSSHSVGIVRTQTQAMEFVFVLFVTTVSSCLFVFINQVHKIFEKMK
jgi:hypothetical protein